MAIFRCNKCGHIREVGSDYIGKSVKCPKCDNSSTIHDTVVFLNALIKKIITQTKEVHKLRRELSNESLEETTENFILEDIDIHNTNVLAQKVSVYLTPSSQAWQCMAYTPSTRRRTYAGRFPSPIWGLKTAI
jgi:phage FluMu protein Com